MLCSCPHLQAIQLLARVPDPGSHSLAGYLVEFLMRITVQMYLDALQPEFYR